MRMSLQSPVLLKTFLPFCKLRLQIALHGAEISATCQMQQKLGRFQRQRVTADKQTVLLPPRTRSDRTRHTETWILV
jgi:hypothetical protein